MLQKSNLKGYQAPGMLSPTVVSLFADNTIVYLTEDNDFEDLLNILDDWCKASGVKFNISKTEIIPIGSKTYQRWLTETRKLNQSQPEI